MDNTKRFMAALLGCTALFGTPALAQNVQDANEVETITVFGRVAADTTFSIPQTVEVLDADLIETTASVTVGDALRFVAGAQRDGSPLDSFGDTYLIRGFEANQTLNGLYANNIQQARDTIGIERVEVLRGPASVLYGQLQPGAVVNIVTKQPKRTVATEASLTYGRFNALRATLDTTGPLNTGGSLRYRLTAAYDDAESFIDFWGRRHVFIAPVFAMDLGASTTLTFEGFYARNKLDGFFNGVPAAGTVLPNPNGVLPRSLSLTDPTLPASTRENSNISIRLDHEFASGWRWRSVLDWTDESRDEANVLGIFGWDVQDQVLSRILLAGGGSGSTWTFHNDFASEFNTGAFNHSLVVGADYSARDRTTPRRVFFLPSLDLFNPVYSTNAPPAMTEIASARRVIEEQSYAGGLFAQDRVDLNDQLKIVGGVRYSRFKETARTILPNAPSESTDRQSHTAWTSQLGLLFTPRENLAWFASRTTSFLPTYGVAASGEALEPETGTQYEAGLKAKLAGGRAFVGASVFHLTRGDVVVADRDNPGFQISIGEQVAKGFELTIDAKPIDGLRLHAAYAYTDAETTEDTDASLRGLRIRNVPEHSFVLYGDYEWREGPLSGLTAGGSASYTGDRAGELLNTFDLPSYWRIDLHASYALNERIELGGRVENITDERYFDYAYSELEVWPGAPRTWKVFIRSKF